MTSTIEKIKSGLIVSCQAPVKSVLHEPQMIAAIASAAVQGGAVGVRIDTPEHVRAVRQHLDDTPIIGLWKRHFPDSEVYITPRFSDAAAIADAGADIIAVDATLRKRPAGENVAAIIRRISQELGKLVMADVDTLESAIAARDAGADIVATTLYGYTAETKESSPPGYSLLEQTVSKMSLPVVCEGGIASPEMAQKALQLGAYAVVVGTAITGIDAKVKAFGSVFKDSAAKS